MRYNLLVWHPSLIGAMIEPWESAFMQKETWFWTNPHSEDEYNNEILKYRRRYPYFHDIFQIVKMNTVFIDFEVLAVLF